MPSVVRSYSGRCRLKFDIGVELETDFQLQLRSDGNIDVIAKAPGTLESDTVMKALEDETLVTCSLIGSIPNATGKIAIPKLLLKAIEIENKYHGSIAILELISLDPAEIEYAQTRLDQTVEIHYGLTNFVFMGCEYSRWEGGISLDKFTTKLDGMKLTFKHLQGYRSTVKDLTRSRDGAVTAEAIATVSSASMKQVDELVGDALVLLSYATGTYIAAIYQDVYSSDALIKSTLYFAKTGPYVPDMWIIDANNLYDCDLQIFLETCYPRLNELKSDLGLNVVLEFLVLANQSGYLEVRFLLYSVAAECLLSYLPSYLKKIGETGDMSSFRSKMKNILEHFNMAYRESELDFIRIRDHVVHTGRFPSNVDPSKETDKLGNLLDRTVLTILGYKGKFYLNRTNRYAREVLL